MKPLSSPNEPAAPSIPPPPERVEAPSPAKPGKGFWRGLIFTKAGLLLIVGAIAVVLLGLSAYEDRVKAKGQAAGAGPAVEVPPASALNLPPQASAPKPLKPVSLAQQAANTTPPADPAENIAYPAGSARPPDQSPDGAAAKGPRAAGDEIVRRNVSAPIPTTVKPQGKVPPVDGAASKSKAALLAGAPAYRVNGEQKLREVMGKIRVGATEAKSGPEKPAGSGPLIRPSAVAPESVPKLEEDFAPYGRLVKCKLVFTVDSINLATPIVAFVMEDVWWNGKLIIPAGSEVFSRAVPNRILNRIGDDGKWTFVMPEQETRINGRELLVKGFALDRSEKVVTADGRTRAWNLNDGSAGLQGEVIDTNDPARLRLLVATIVKGAAEGFSGGLQNRESTPGIGGALGLTQATANLKNAAINGAGQGVSGVIDLMMKQISDEIQQNGAYVRVNAGKEFYVFIDQSVDPTAARVGLRLQQSQTP